MLDELVAEQLPPEAREALVDRAEGNPFFLEELLTAFLDAGSLAAELPDSVHAILSARVDRLSPADKGGLQAAAVVGRIFWSDPVFELTGGAQADWTLLEDRDFVRRTQGSSAIGGAEYTFKHALTREVVYTSVPKARRAQLHADLAEWLERTGGGRDEHVALLAHHYAQAANPADADLAWADQRDRLEATRPRRPLAEPRRRARDQALRPR